jgi:hypothetical protein
MKLDQDFIKIVYAPIWATWNAISPDAHCDDNEEAIELCLDADRLITTAQGTLAEKEALDADMAIDEAINKHSYEAVIKFLSKNVQLV